MAADYGEIWSDVGNSIVRGGAKPLHKQLFDALTHAIDSGWLTAGEPVLSTRELAKRIGVSRVTVIQTYNQLLSRGYLESVQSSGTFVRRSLVLPGAENHQHHRSEEARLSQYGKRLAQEPVSSACSAEQPVLYCGGPSLEHLPVVRWKQMVQRASVTPSQLQLSDTFGCMSLRQALADYVRRARSIICKPEQVAVFSNSQAALALLSQMLVDDGDCVAVENPGFGAAREAFLAREAQLLLVPVDQQGMSVDALQSSSMTPRLIYVTPSHQDPTGAMLPLERRRALTLHNRDAKSWIIEDDFDCEFRYGEANLPAIQTMDRTGHVIYLSSFWRTLNPLCSLAFVILPPSLCPSFARAKALIDRSLPLLEQQALTALIDEGYFEKHIRLVRGIYSKRRQALIGALTRALARDIFIARHSAGLHQLVRFLVDIEEGALLELAARAGLPLVSTADYYVGETRSLEFLVSFAQVSEEQISQSVQVLAQLVRGCSVPLNTTAAFISTPASLVQSA